MRYDIAPRQFICSICSIKHSNKNSARWRLLFNEGKFIWNAIPGQDGIYRKYTGSFTFSSFKTTHIIHKCRLNYEYINVEHRQPSFVNFQCARGFEDNSWGVMLPKHGPSKMFRFFHGGFFTVNGLLMYVRHINVYNTNVVSIIQKIWRFNKKMTHYPA